MAKANDVQLVFYPRLKPGVKSEARKTALAFNF